MHTFLVKSTSTLMALVLAISASLCRCGMAACETPRPATAAQTDPATRPCPNHCSPTTSPSTDGKSPATCTDCEKSVSLTKPQPVAFHAAPQLHPFLTTAVDAAVTPPAMSRSSDIGAEPPDARIDVLLRSCILLI